jgi:hypothetical protein
LQATHRAPEDAGPEEQGQPVACDVQEPAEPERSELPAPSEVVSEIVPEAVPKVADDAAAVEVPSTAGAAVEVSSSAADGTHGEPTVDTGTFISVEDEEPEVAQAAVVAEAKTETAATTSALEIPTEFQDEAATADAIESQSLAAVENMAATADAIESQSLAPAENMVEETSIAAASIEPQISAAAAVTTDPQTPASGTIRPGSALGSAVVPLGDHRRIWRPRRNKCPDETDADPSWYRHRRHLVIFTYSGKPVYTRYGAEEGISGTTGTLSAIVSKFASFFFNNQGRQDSLRYMVAGEHMFVFLEKGPLWLVCVSCCGDTYQDIVRLLDRVYQQVITILTNSLERTLQAHPNYDARNLLAGTDPVVNSMVRWCTQDMYLQLDGFEALPLAPTFRTIAVEALRSARIPNVLVGFLMAGHRVLAVVTNRQYRLHALDLLAIINLIMSSASLRTVESWTPVCLVHLNDKAFAYAYISFVEESDVGVVFLSTSSEGEQFYAISQQAATIKKTLKTSGCLAAVTEAISCCPVTLGSTDDAIANAAARNTRKPLLAPFPIGQAKLLDGIIHAAYFMPASQQFFSSAISLPYRSRRRTKMLFRSYGRCRLLLKNAKMPSQICIATDHECFYVSLAAEFHIYLTVPRGISTGVIGLFYQWVKSQEAHLFLSIPSW